MKLAVLNRIVCTNDKLFAFRIVESPYCTFFKNDVESPEHLPVFFFFCKVLVSRHVLERAFIVDSPL